MTDTQQLESTMRDGRVIVTFATDLGPGPHGPDDLHYLHVERVRRHIAWRKLDPTYQDDPEVMMHFADHLPGGRIVGRDGMNYATGRSSEAKLRAKLAELEHRQDVLADHFPDEPWADVEADAIRDEIGEVTEELLPHDRAAARRNGARRERRRYHRARGRIAPVRRDEDTIIRHRSLHALNAPIGRGTMSAMIGEDRDTRKIAQVGA